MNLWSFFKDKCLLIILHIICMCALGLFLKLTGSTNTNITLIMIFWAIILGIWLVVTYLERRKFFSEIRRILDQTDQRYLLGELLPDSFRLEDRLYREMIRCSNKSVIETIRQIEAFNRDYKDYIESWVHEAKAPLTGISLLCENGRNYDDTSGIKEMFDAISLENQKIGCLVDTVLYYARSENVYKDFFIRKTDLQEIVEDILKKNRLLFIQNHVRAEVNCPHTVYTDRKWIEFILNQIILNCVKYCNESPVFLIYTKQEQGSVLLTVEDNGTGIRSEELPRIFEKGFTGSNGRSHDRATGMGLYLCKNLCGKLGIGLHAESEYGKGTKMLLTFPISNYINPK